MTRISVSDGWLCEDVHHHFVRIISNFFTWLYTNMKCPCKFLDFSSYIRVFTIYSLVNEQIIILIGTLVLKIIQMHTTSWDTSRSIPKKFEMILWKLKYTSTKRVSTSNLVTRISVSDGWVCEDVHHHFVSIISIFLHDYTQTWSVLASF